MVNPRILALLLVLPASVALASVKRSIDPRLKSAATINLVEAPWTVTWSCRRLQARVRFAVLCPTVLPRAVLGYPGEPPPVLGSDRYASSEPGLDIGYGAPWETDSGGGVTKAKVAPHLWRNRPCCFLHFVVQRQVGPVPPTAEPHALGGVRGRLLPATGAYYGGPYFANHVRFFFRRFGVNYVATLHAFGNEATAALLGRIVAGLRPARTLAVVRPRGVATGAVSIASADRGLWIAASGDPIHGFAYPDGFERHALVRVDAASGRVEKHVGLRMTPNDVVFFEGSLWVAGYRGNRGVVARVDARSGRVTAILRAGRWPRALAFWAGRLWLVTSAPWFKRGAVVEIDSRAKRTVGPPIGLGPAPARVGAGRSGVWVPDALENAVARVDPRRRKVVARVRVGQNPYGVAVGPRSVWVTNVDDGTVSRIDPAVDRVVATIRVGRNPHGIALGQGAVWVANLGDGTVSRIDPATNRAGRPIKVGGDPLALIALRSGVWVTRNTDGTLTKLPLR